MGWVVSVVLFLGYLFHGDTNILIASGLFAIAGAISFYK